MPCWPQGAEWFCLPSAFTVPTGRAHWEILLRARAIENLCHLVAPAQSGFHENGRETHGDSMIVEPWGRVLARLPRGTGVITAELDFARQRRLRQDFPAVDHRRLALGAPSQGIMKPNIPPPMFAPQPAALAAAVAQRDPLDVARSALLLPAELDENRVARVLGDVMGHAVDYGDIYFQLTREESWALEDGIVKDGAHAIEQGVGVRALAGEKTGFAYSDEVMLPALLEAAHAARAISRSGSGGSVQAWHATGGRALYSAVDPVETLADDDKVKLLEQIDREARALDPRISQVMASLSASHDTVLVMASDGTLAGDVRPLVRLNVSVIIEQDGRREQGYAGGGGRFAYTEFLASGRWKHLVARGRAYRAGQPRGGAGPGWHDDRRARRGLARRAAARGRGPRSRRRLQSQGHLGIQRPHRPAGCGKGRHDRRRRHAASRAAARSTSTTRARRRSARP